MKSLILVAAAIACVSSSGSAQVAHPQTEDSPVADYYASAHGITLGEAKRRLGSLQKITDMEKRIKQLAPNQFAGMYIDHSSFHAVVRMVPNRAMTLSRITSDPLFVSENATVSLAKLQRVERQIVNLMTVLRIPMDEGIDVERGVIDVAVLDENRARAVLAGILIGNRFVSVRKVDALVRNTTAILGGNLASGSAGQDCTTGFSVRGVAGDGITTAGHCDNTISVSGRSQTLQAENYTNSTTNGYDLQWNRRSGDTYPNQVQIRTNGTLMDITQTYDAKTLPANWPICKFGQSTGYTCGEVVGQQNTTDNRGVTGRFIRVRPTGSGPMTTEGDSGGPVFGDRVAYGSIKGRGGSSNPNDLYFMSVSDFAPLNITVKTAP